MSLGQPTPARQYGFTVCDFAHFMAKSNVNLILDVCLFKDKSLHLKSHMCEGEVQRVPSTLHPAKES